MLNQFHAPYLLVNSLELHNSITDKQISKFLTCPYITFTDILCCLI